MKQKKTKQESVNKLQQLHQSVNPEERKIPANKKYNLLFILAIFITGIIAYSNSFDCSFHFDDDYVFNIRYGSFTANSLGILDWLDFIPTRPIGMLTFALNYHFHGLDVWGYHLVNLTIHLINALLVWWLTWITFSTPVMKNAAISKHKTMVAFLTGMLFVTHPLATQSVTYIAQRFSSLATLFYLLSLILFVQGKLWQRGRNIPWFLFGGSIVCAVMGMLTKEIVFTLPFAIILYDYCFLKAVPWKLEIKDKSLIISFIILVIFILLFLRSHSLNIFETVPPDQGYSYSISMKEYFLTQFRVILTYVRLFVLPVNQNLDYDYPLSTCFFHLKTFLSFSLLLGILATGVLLFKRYRLISFGIFWFFLTMSVESSIIPISQNVIFEHRTYLPGFGFFLALTGTFFYLFKERYLKIAVIILLMVAAINTVLTYQRNKIWLNEYTLWSDCLKKSPNKARVHSSLGNTYQKLGQYQRAIEEYNEAIRITPDYADYYYDRGTAYGKLSQYQQAIEDYNKAISLKKDYAEAYNGRGDAHNYLGHYQQAIEDFNKAISLEPDYGLAYYNRGLAYDNLGQYQNAIENYNEAILLNPNYADAYNNRGNVYNKFGQYQRAIDDFNKAIHLQPNNAGAYNNRGLTYLLQGYNEPGCYDLQKACEMGGGCKALEWAKGNGNCH